MKNWKKVEEDEVEEKTQINRNNEIDVAFEMYNNNVKLSKKAFKGAVENKLQNSFKPGGSIGLITGKD